MSDSVPDPDDGMLDPVEAVDQVVDEPEEPTDDLNLDYLDSTNSNHDEFIATAEEPAPTAPEDYKLETKFLKEVTRKTPGDIIVNTEAVDLETVCNLFRGVILHERLQFIIDHCPILRRDATIALVRSLKDSTMNVTRYNSLMTSLEKLDEDPHCTRNQELPKLDSPWVEVTQAKAQNLLDSLQAEYKKMKDEGVKESTRRAMEELFGQYVAVGNYFDALRLYGRGMREYCTQFKHLMKMWLEWIEVSVCAGEWSKVEPLLSQTQRSINEAEEAEEVAQNSNRQNADGHGQGESHSRANRAFIATCQSKIDALHGVCQVRACRYSSALEKFTKTDVDLMGSGWLFSSSDIAVFTTLCALVTYDRVDLKKRVLTHSLCRKFLEAEPKLIELLTAFIRSDFGKCLDILNQRKDSFYLNPFISSQINEIYEKIRERAIIQYVRPFAVAKIDVMAEVFRVSPEEMEDELFSLIEKDKIFAKIDALEGVVRTLDVNPRTDTIEKVNELYDKLIETSNSVMCRALIIHSRTFTGGDGRNKRKEPTDEGFEPVGRRGMPSMLRMLGPRNNYPSTSGKRRAEPDSSENNDFYDM